MTSSKIIPGGRVRVRRPLAQPNFGYKPVEEGFPLMPGDIVSIDGGASVEIAWVNGNRIIAQVPFKVKLKDKTFENDQMEIVMFSSAYDSGFPNALEKIRDKITPTAFGFGAKKGFEVLVETLVGKVGKETLEFLVELYTGISDKKDLSDSEVMTRIRVRSKVIIDSTEDDLKVYNIEGSPIVKTAAGGEVTLTNGKMVTVSDDGRLNAPQTFDTKTVESQFRRTLSAATSPSTSPAKSTAPVSRPAPPTKGSPLPTQDIVRVAGLILVAVVVFGLGWLGRRRRSKS